MEYAKLGWSEIEVSKVCLGGMTFGKASPDFHQWTIDQPSTQEVIKHALDFGINFIDTANVYAFGTSEEYIGQSLKNLGVKREDVVLASKVHFNEGGLSAKAIEREIEGTLSRLDTDYLDLYIIHRFDYDVPMEETLEALHKLVKAGKVRALGASAMYAYQFHNFQTVAEREGFTKFTSMQNHYNLLYREDERELIPVCKQYDVAITPYSPLASGHLTHVEWESDSVRGRTDKTLANKYELAKEQDIPIVERVKKIADEKSTSMASVAFAWLIAKGCTSPIVGCSKPQRVDDAVRGLELKLTQDEIDFLEEPYVAHELVGPKSRPGEKALAGTTKVKIKHT